MRCLRNSTVRREIGQYHSRFKIFKTEIKISVVRIKLAAVACFAAIIIIYNICKAHYSQTT